MNPNNEDSSIFIDEKNSELSELKSGDSQAPRSIPYLKRGDSSAYINQFLEEKSEEFPVKVENNFAPTVKEEPHEENARSEEDSPSENRQETCANPSAFHNFQKHLTVALKHAIILPNQQKTAKDYVRAAIKLWKIFAQSKICTKKVLHFLLGERNQHQITAEDLREFGFSKIYETFGDKVVRESRKYLLSESLRQIKQGCLDAYFANKKIKDKEKFKKYVDIFVQELEEGFLKKRLSREKVAELLG